MGERPHQKNMFNFLRVECEQTTKKWCKVLSMPQKRIAPLRTPTRFHITGDSIRLDRNGRAAAYHVLANALPHHYKFVNGTPYALSTFNIHCCICILNLFVVNIAGAGIFYDTVRCNCRKIRAFWAISVNFRFCCAKHTSTFVYKVHTHHWNMWNLVFELFLIRVYQYMVNIPQKSIFSNLVC